jgi:hypothetical protein
MEQEETCLDTRIGTEMIPLLLLGEMDDIRGALDCYPAGIPSRNDNFGKEGGT